jgi:hypothetical protein
MPANCGLLRIGRRSPSSVFGHFRGENAESLWPHAGLFPFSGDGDRRLGSIPTAWPATQCGYPDFSRPVWKIENMRGPRIGAITLHASCAVDKQHYRSQRHGARHERCHPMALRCHRVGAVHSIKSDGSAMSALLPLCP